MNKKDTYNDLMELKALAFAINDKADRLIQREQLVSTGRSKNKLDPALAAKFLAKRERTRMRKRT